MYSDSYSNQCNRKLKLLKLRNDAVLYQYATGPTFALNAALGFCNFGLKWPRYTVTPCGVFWASGAKIWMEKGVGIPQHARIRTTITSAFTTRRQSLQGWASVTSLCAVNSLFLARGFESLLSHITTTFSLPLLHWPKIYRTVPLYTVVHCSTECQNSRKRNSALCGKLAFRSQSRLVTF